MPSSTNFYLPLAQAAEQNGVGRHAIADWLRRRQKYRRPYRIKEGHQVYIRIDVLEAYAERRAALRPPGWPTFKRVCAELEVVRGSKLITRLSSDLRIVIYRNTRYIHPDDAALLKLRFRRACEVPVGMVRVRAVAQLVERTPEALFLWLQQRGYPVTIIKRLAYISRDRASEYRRFVNGK